MPACVHVRVCAHVSPRSLPPSLPPACAPSLPLYRASARMRAYIGGGFRCGWQWMTADTRTYTSVESCMIVRCVVSCCTIASCVVVALLCVALLHLLFLGDEDRSHSHTRTPTHYLPGAAHTRTRAPTFRTAGKPARAHARMQAHAGAPRCQAETFGVW